VLFENGRDYFDTEDCCRGGGESFVYDWSPEEGMTIASILPSGRLATDAGVGAGPLDQIDPELGANAYSAFYGGSPHAISEDGERLFFTDPSPSGGTPVGHIYERRHQGKPDASTVQIDKIAPGTPESEAVRYGMYSSVFVAATPDGREVLFPSCVKLTPDSTAGEGGPGWSCRTQWGNKYNAAAYFNAKSDLYIYSEEEGGTSSLKDITTADPSGAKVLGVLGESEDLSRVYFVADGELAPGATKGKPNLYVWAKTGETTETTFLDFRAFGALDLILICCSPSVSVGA
jgi:hypothetical protein